MTRDICCVNEDGKKCGKIIDVDVWDGDLFSSNCYGLCWEHYRELAETIHQFAKIKIKEVVEFT